MNPSINYLREARAVVAIARQAEVNLVAEEAGRDAGHGRAVGKGRVVAHRGHDAHVGDED